MPSPLGKLTEHTLPPPKRRLRAIQSEYRPDSDFSNISYKLSAISAQLSVFSLPITCYLSLVTCYQNKLQNTPKKYSHAPRPLLTPLSYNLQPKPRQLESNAL